MRKALFPHFDHVMQSLALPPCAPVAVALSGGADSMALALLLKEWCNQEGRALTALTVDHGLRPESASEAAQVAQWMGAHGIAHHVMTLAPLPSGNLQARARDARYGALAQECRKHSIESLCVAHHADDQAETVALQRHRGDSPPSRCGMALVSAMHGVHLIRPLLGVRKSQLIAYLRTQDQLWIEDPSNASDAYARNRLRQTLSEEETLSLWRGAQEQGALRHAQDVARAQWYAQYATQDAAGLYFERDAWDALEEDAAHDILSRAIQQVGQRPHRPRYHETLRLAGAVRASAGGKATLGKTLVHWDAHRIALQPEHTALATAPGAPHMEPAAPRNLLAGPPFWWFNHEPLL